MKVKLKTFTVVSTTTPASITSGLNTLDNKQILQTASTRIKALKANSGPVKIGTAESQDWELQPGDEVEMTEIFEKDGGSADINLADVWVVGAGSICVMYADRSSPFRS